MSSKEPTERSQALGELIRERRLELNMGQLPLARALGVSQATYSRIETGRHQVYVNQLVKIGQVLGKPAWVFEYELAEKELA